MDYLKHIFDFAIAAVPTILIALVPVWAVARRYLEKRIELLATKADLREQTQIIERAKVEQAASLWLSQERWREQKESAFKVVEWLTNLHSSLVTFRTTIKANVALLDEIDNLRLHEADRLEAVTATSQRVEVLEKKAASLAEALTENMTRVSGQLDLAPIFLARLLLTSPELNHDLGKVFEHARNQMMLAKNLGSSDERARASEALSGCAEEFMRAAKTVAASYREALGFDDQTLDAKVEKFLRRN